MQSSIEVFLDHFNEELHKFLQDAAHKREHIFEYTVQDDQHSYCIILGRDYWNYYRNKLIRYVQEHSIRGEVVIEFDRLGDCMDKNIRYTYKGGNNFYVEYRSMELSYKGSFSINV